MIRDEDGALTGYVYVDLNTRDYGGFVNRANDLLRKMKLPAGYTYQWSGEYEFELRAKQRLKLILPVVFFVIFLLLYMIFKSVTEAAGPDFSNRLRHDRRTAAAMAAWLQLQRSGLGRLYRAVRDCGGNRRGDGRVSA